MHKIDPGPDDKTVRQMPEEVFENINESAIVRGEIDYTLVSAKGKTDAAKLNDKGEPHSAEPERAYEKPLPYTLIIEHTRYMLVETMGKGGMGTAGLYEKMDDPLHTKNTLDQWVVVKRAHMYTPEQREELELSMKHEVTINAQIAGTRDKVTKIGLEYIVIPWKQGCPLSAPELKDLPQETSLLLAYKLARALVGIHEKKVVHADLKPANTVITPDGQVTLIDFGTGRDMDAATSPFDDNLTGTPYYIAPEQWIQQALTEKTDVYALGVMLHEMLTDEAGTKMKNPDPDLSENLGDMADRDIAAILEKMLKKKVNDRVSMKEAAGMLALECRRRGIDPEQPLFEPITKDLPVDPRMPQLKGMDDAFRNMPIDPADVDPTDVPPAFGQEPKPLLKPKMLRKALLEADHKRHLSVHGNGTRTPATNANTGDLENQHSVTEGEDPVTVRNGMAV